MHVLLVADKPHEALRLKEWLISGLGPEHEVEHFDNLNEALIQMQIHPLRVDVLIVDLIIPPDDAQMIGLSLAQRRAPAMAIVVISDEDEGDIAQTAIRSGAQEYFVKSSLNAKRLAEIVTREAAVARRRAEALKGIQTTKTVVSQRAVVLCELSPLAVERLARKARILGKTTQDTLEQMILGDQTLPDDPRSAAT